MNYQELKRKLGLKPTAIDAGFKHRITVDKESRIHGYTIDRRKTERVTKKRKTP
jgi:hypothetical protein